MGLLQNFSVLNAEPLHYIGAGTGVATAPAVGSAACMDRARRNRPEQFMNMAFSQADIYDSHGKSILQKAAYPEGYAPPYQFKMPMRDGGMSAFTDVHGAGIASSTSLSMGINLRPYNNFIYSLTGEGLIPTVAMSMAYHFGALITAFGEISSESSMKGAVRLMADLVGEGEVPEVQLNILAWCQSTLEGIAAVTSVMDLPVALSSSIEGQGTVSAALVGLTYMLADLSGNSSIELGLKFPANLESNAIGSGDLEETVLRAIAWCVSDILGEGTATNSDLRGKSFMEASISFSTGTLTAQDCAAAVWNALATSYNNAGSMGTKMNSAASAGDPWSGIMDNYTDDATFGAFIKKLLQTNEFFGLR